MRQAHPRDPAAGDRRRGRAHGSRPPQLYSSGLLDSLATVSLIVAFEEAFGLVISPAEFDRDAWGTPQMLVADIERRLAEGAAA